MSRRATDYEARAAQAWKNPEQVHGSEGENKPVLGLLANGRYALPNIANLNQRAEDEFTPEGITLNNTADTAARQDRPPDDTYTAPTFKPEGFDEAFYGPRGDVFLSHIASKTNTHISVKRGETSVIEIWGDPEPCAQAKRDLDQLKTWALNRANKKKKQKPEGDRIAKVRAAPTEPMMVQMMLNREQHDKRQFFRKMPEPEQRDFDNVGHFTWPTTEFNPASCLGMNYESLDRIRVEQECFIDFDRKNSEFVVLGRKDNNVAIAISRIYGVFCEIAARNRLPTKGNLVEPPQKQELLSDVYLDRRHSLVNRQITFKVHVDNSGAQCHLTGHTPPMVRGPFADWESKRSSILRANHLYLRKVVQQALNDLIYIRSHVTMKVNFGTLVLFAYQQPKENVFPLMEFMQMLRGKQTQTELLRHIGTENLAKELITICHGRNEVFIPVHGSFPEVTDHPERMYAATFELRLVEERASQNIRLEVEFGRETPIDGRMQYSVVTHNWLFSPKHTTQHSNDKTTGEGIYKRKGPLDLKCLDLVAGLAWQLEISTYSRVPETDVYLIYGDFLKNIKLDVTRNGAATISFTNLPGLEFKSVVQKTKSQWYISATNYVWEVVKYEYFNGHGKTYPEGVSSSVKGLKSDIRWGANLTNRDWIEHLAAQALLPIGASGVWDPDVYKFFKPSNVGGLSDPIEGGDPRPRKEWQEDGFEEFLGRIKDCVELISRATKSLKIRGQLTRRGVRESDMD